MLNDGPLTIDRREGKNPGTRVFCLSGPLTLRNLFELQTELRGSKPPPLTVIDLTAVPYMDSAGMGLVMNHYVRCQTKGVKIRRRRSQQPRHGSIQSDKGRHRAAAGRTIEDAECVEKALVLLTATSRHSVFSPYVEFLLTC